METEQENCKTGFFPVSWAYVAAFSGDSAQDLNMSVPDDVRLRTGMPAPLLRWGLPGVSAASTFISGLVGRFRFMRLRWESICGQFRMLNGLMKTEGSLFGQML